MQNQLVLTATVLREEVLRYTPAGMPVLEMWLSHHSKQNEAGLERVVNCEIQAVMLGEIACEWSGKLAGQVVTLTGFLCQRSLKNPRLVLHIEYVEFVKG